MSGNDLVTLRGGEFDGGLRRIVSLGRHSALPHQIAKALQILAGLLQLGLAGGNIGVLRMNTALLSSLVSLQTLDSRFFHLDLRLAFRHPRPEIRIIDRNQQVAGFDLLIVFKVNRFHITGLTGTDQRHMRFQIGVIGTLEGLDRDPPIQETAQGRTGQQQQRDESLEEALE